MRRLSEKTAAYVAFAGGMALAALGIAKGVQNLEGLGWLVLAVCSPLIGYGGFRTWKKVGNGKDVE